MYKEAFMEAQKIVKDCGSYLRFKQFEQLEYKTGINDLVTDLDKKAELYIKRKLMNVIKGATFVGEEGNKEISNHMWIIDPIDGTTNFVCSHENFAISIAYYEKQKPVFGIVYDVMRDEMFYAYTGKGAWLNATKLSLLSSKNIKECVWDASLNSIIEIGEYYNTSLETLSLKTRGHRSLGCASLSIVHIAQGKLDLYLSAHVKCWDFAAAIIILHECGGCEFIENSFFTLSKTPAIFAGNELILKEMKSEYFECKG